MILKMIVPSSITSISLVKMRIRESENKNTKMPNVTTILIDITSAALTPCFTRSYCLAPKFCPTKVVIASIKLLTGNPIKLSILFEQENPATPLAPN